MSNTVLFSAIAGNQKIDAEAGVISGVSVITIGECAGKHEGTWVDETTLTQLLTLAKNFKDGVKVKLSQNKEHDGSVGQIIGTLKNFQIAGQHLRADLHLLKSDEQYAKILEMSALMPEAFGLSVVVPHNYEKSGKKQFLRPTDIFSVDLVEQPAANNSGLFSANPMSKEVKYAKGNEGEHANDCECKECMSKHSKKSMSVLLAETLGLAADATDETIVAKLAEAIKPKTPAVPAEIAALTAKMTEHETQLAAYRASAEASALSAKKTEIATLVADATRDGKVVPLTDEQLAKMDIPVIKEMFSKLTPGQVKLSGTRKVAPPKAADGKPITFKTADERAEFCLTKQAEGAAMLTAQFMADNSLGLTRN